MKQTTIESCFMSGILSFDCLQSMGMQASFIAAQEECEEKSNEPERREDPHAEFVSTGIRRTCCGNVVGPSNQEVEPEQAYVLHHRHQTVCGSEFRLVDDVCHGGPHDCRNERERDPHHGHGNHKIGRY